MYDIKQIILKLFINLYDFIFKLNSYNTTILLRKDNTHIPNLQP